MYVKFRRRCTCSLREYSHRNFRHRVQQLGRRNRRKHTESPNEFQLSNLQSFHIGSATVFGCETNAGINNGTSDRP